MARTVYSEDELSRKWDRCIYDSILKIGGGFAVGATASLLFLKRRTWPLIFGSSFGLGLAYGNCEREIKNFLTLPPYPAESKSEN